MSIGLEHCLPELIPRPQPAGLTCGSRLDDLHEIVLKVRQPLEPGVDGPNDSEEDRHYPRGGIGRSRSPNLFDLEPLVRSDLLLCRSTELPRIRDSADSIT